MTIFSLTPDYDIVNVGGFPGDVLQVHDHRFVAHIGDLLSLLLRMDVMFHDSPINIKNDIFTSRLKEIVVRPVPGNHEQVCKDITQAIDHLEFLRSNGAYMLPDGTVAGYNIPYRDGIEISTIRHELKQMRSMIAREIIFEECPQRMRSNRWGNGLKFAFDQLAGVMARYNALEAVKNHPWKEEDATALENIRKERGDQFKQETECRHLGVADLLLPEFMLETAPKPELPRDDVRLDLSAFGLSPEQLTGLAEKAKEFGAEYHTYDKGVVLSFIPFSDYFEEGVRDD